MSGLNHFAAKLHAEVLRLDGGKTAVGSEGYRAAMMLLAAENVGANLYAIAKVLDWEPERLADLASNAVEGGLWVDGKQLGSEKWFEEDGGIPFTLAVGVATGSFQLGISPDEPDEPRYSLTEKGRARAADLIRSTGGTP